MRKQIVQGAESTITFSKQTVTKTRLPKSYRIVQIDSELIKRRTRAEMRILSKVKRLGIPCPTIHEATDDTIIMDFINAPKARDVFDTYWKQIATQLARYLRTLHENNIIHGDLTTSNMLFDSKKLYLIDFGLSFVSEKIEDKAVDLHVLKEAIVSYHAPLAERFFVRFSNAYGIKNVLERLVAVEKRGKNKH